MDNQSTKVLALVTDAWGGTGGIAQYCRDFLEAVAKRGDVSELVVIPRVIARDVQPVPAKLRHLTSAAGSKGRFVHLALKEALRQPDLIICGHINLLPIAWLAAKFTKAPIILLTYGIEVWDQRGGIWKFLVQSCAGIVSISQFTLDKVRAWASINGIRTFLVPNGVDLSTYSPGPRNTDLAARLGISDARPLLLTIGRMDAAEQAKGFDEILEILPAIEKEFPHVQYCAAGDGSDRLRLQRKAQALGISGRVTFPGYVDEADKPDLYRLADLYVMPSRLEGFGYVFLEALACGIPVVASSIDGSREAVLQGRLGSMADPRNPEELLRVLVSSLRQPFVPPRTKLEHFSKSQFLSRVMVVLDAMRNDRKNESQ